MCKNVFLYTNEVCCRNNNAACWKEKATLNKKKYEIIQNCVYINSSICFSISKTFLITNIICRHRVLSFLVHQQGILMQKNRSADLNNKLRLVYKSSEKNIWKIYWFPLVVTNDISWRPMRYAFFSQRSH